jgi:hypothetical protein
MAALLSGSDWIVCFRNFFELVRLIAEDNDEQHPGVDARLLAGVTRLGTQNKFGTAKYG